MNPSPFMAFTLVICCALMINSGSTTIMVALQSASTAQITLNSAQSAIVEAPHVASDPIPWCNPALFANPIDFSQIAPPEEKDFPAKPVCKIRTVGKTLSAENAQALRNEALRRFPQLKDIQQVEASAAVQSP